MKITNIIFVILSIILALLAGFILIGKQYGLAPFLSLTFGLFFLVTGIKEFQTNQKQAGYVSIAICLISLYVAYQRFIN